MTYRSRSDAIVMSGPLTEEAEKMLSRPTQDLVVIRHIVRDSVLGIGVESSFEIRAADHKSIRGVLQEA